MRPRAHLFAIARAALVIPLLVLAACSKTASLPSLPPNANVLAFGDSLTFGTGAAADQSYPALLTKTIGREVINRGVPGEVSADGLSRLGGVLEEVKPALLILCHGGNDFLRKLPASATEANLRSMIKLARERNVAVVLIATPQPGLLLSVPDFYERIAKEFSIPIESKVLAEVLGDNALKSDLVHPNAVGYAKISTAITTLLQKSGALS
jgi:acyl-CoA thioesterase I